MKNIIIPSIIIIVMSFAGCGVKPEEYALATNDIRILEGKNQNLESDYSNKIMEFDNLSNAYAFLSNNPPYITDIIISNTIQTDFATNVEISNIYFTNIEVLTNTAIETNNDELNKTIAGLMVENSSISNELELLKIKYSNDTKTLEEKSDRTEKIYQDLKASFKRDIDAGNLKISKIYNLICFSIQEEVFFDSGKAAVKSNGRVFLKKLGKILYKMNDKFFFVEGHTDNVPIGDAAFTSNWDLGAARAISVVQYLQEITGIPGSRLAVVSYSKYRPLASNITESGKAKNRRIQISIVDKTEYDMTRMDHSE